ncbi:seipin-like [Asterias rubens]|uniref:seipin-like n=1 Tax=Asterias rubens TaxID=7604 RepID=UPI00145504A1|nr:seipin-like [Asterias rubens]
MSGIFRRKANAVMESVATGKDRWVSWLKGTTLKVMGFLMLGTLQLWISLFLYGSFYYSYMPTVAHISPVFLQFSSCVEYGTQLNCPFPSVNTTLVKNLEGGTSLLMRGQRYQVLLELEMPQSPVNENLGMFMVKADMLSLGGEVTATSSRPAMLRYRSGLLKLMETLILSPFMLSGYSEEKQLIRVSLIESFVDNPYKPTTGVYVELQARQLQVYSSVLKIQAYFSGLRFLMYHWPLTTALVFITMFFVFLSLITVLSWQQCIKSFSSQEEELVVRMDDVYSVGYEERRRRIKKNLESERAVLFRGRPSNVKTVGNCEDDRESHSSGISSVGDVGSSIIIETIKPSQGAGSSGSGWEDGDKQPTPNEVAILEDVQEKVEVKEKEVEVVEKVQEEAKEKDENANKEEAEEVVDGMAGEIETDAEPQSSDGSWEVLDKQSASNEVATTEEETLEKDAEDVQEKVEEKGKVQEEVEEVVEGLAGEMETDVEPLVPEGEELRRRLRDPDTTDQ